jgi:hypothetical protein
MSRAMIVVAMTLLAGCAGNKNSTPTTVAPATEAQKAVLLERVKQLRGTWEMVDEHGKPAGQIVYAVSSNGSAVREVMFPGSDEEMTNVYHMDGPTLVMTHYCAAGNQPRMRAAPGGPADPIDLRFDGVSNLRQADEMYMGRMKLTIADRDHIRQEWWSYRSGKEDLAHHVAFDLKRKD